jgi:hypothetical protein
MGFAAVLAVIAGLSVTVAKVVDFTRNLPWFKDRWIDSWVWNAEAFLAGVIVCVGWEHSFVNDLFHQVPALSTVNLTGNLGYVLSGLILGGLSGFAHELMDALSSIATRNRVITLVP